MSKYGSCVACKGDLAYKERDSDLCEACREAGIVWAAKQAYAAANPPPPPECDHLWSQVRGGKVCNKCMKQVND